MHMKKDLGGQWKLKILGDNVFGISEEWMPAQVPGSVYSALLALDKMPDPHYRDNELQAVKLMENDFVFETSFRAEPELLAADALFLCFDGIDTLADIYLNDTLLGHTENMHRAWEFDIKSLAKVGENQLRVVIYSPTKYIKEENEKVYTGGVSEAMAGYPHLRKAHCMFGWDWGPRLPDAGLFRPVYLKAVNVAEIDGVYVKQQFDGMSISKIQTDAEGRKYVAVRADSVYLRFQIDVKKYGVPEEVQTLVKVEAPDGQVYEQEGDGAVYIANPQLWWPNGYGKQPLYTVKVELLNSEGKVIDTWKRRIGLRTMTMNTGADQWGEKFCHQVNGVDVFAMGADYIPEDNLLSRVTYDRTRSLLEDAAGANHNCIRVWGGGYYPEDFFYDICDELGLMVWQDFMFSCSSYELDEDFEENIKEEVRQNVRRIRHHACLGLWCGNNEMEDQVINRSWSPSQKQVYDYIKIFEFIIPKVVKEEDPHTFYWPSSPSSGGNFNEPQAENSGDAHYWDVWHGNKPFTEYRKFAFRYLSEFGFQSYPCLKTVEAFTEEKDRNIFSRVMEMHQRNAAANGKILNYLSAMYQYPKDFDSLLYASQLLQADAIRYGVEHFRRHRGQCMGTVVWQLNDIWPVASWASIDYFGRWKALHYAEKRMFAPVMISCREVGELSERPFCIAEPAPIEKSATLCVTNETFESVEGVVRWSLRDAYGEIVEQGTENVMVDPLSALWLKKLDFSEYDELKYYFSYSFEVYGQEISSGTSLFTPPKHFEFVNPELELTRDGDKLTVKAKHFARFVEIEGVDGDVRLSDNFFDMNPGERTVQILEGDAKEFRVRSVYEIVH
ncbi:MAG: glycoside hydrolase family 2 protein [Lachnospiraceae bacterium]|nr:glycoside hydrolase family 2 protein [Lachnospiraceae bacterium]